MTTDAPRPLGPLEERLARFLYGITGGTLTVRREMRAPGDAVLDAVGRTVLHPPFELRLHDSHGAHPLAGGTLVFTYLPVQISGSTVESVRFRSRLAQIYLRTLDLQLVETRGATAVEVRADLDREVRMGVRWFLAPVVVLGGLLGAATPAVVPATWGAWIGTPGMTGTLAATVGALSGIILITALFRWFCRKAVQWVEEGFEKMLETVDADVTAPGPPPGPRPGG